MKNYKLISILALLILAVFIGCANKTNAQKQNNNTSSQQINTQQPTSNAVQQNSPDTIVNPSPNTSIVQSDPWKNIKPNQVNPITTQQFKELVFDYTKSQTWQYKGDKPCIIDFYADWCRPCRFVSPIMEELAKEYNGQIYFYKINVDNEREVAQVFGIRSIPSVLFCPVKGQPRMAVGAMPKESYIKAISDIFKINPPKSSSK